MGEIGLRNQSEEINIQSDRIYNLFISHCWDRHFEYLRLVNMLDAAEDFFWKNYSVAIENPLAGGSKKKLASEIQSQIRSASAVIVISGMYVTHREWIQFEIDVCDYYAKPLIGLIPRGNVAIPKAIQGSAWAIERWSTASIVRSIIENTN